MNRAQRRAAKRGPAVIAQLEQSRASAEDRVLADARRLIAGIRASDEPADLKRRQVVELIAELEASPLLLLMAGPALVELRALRDQLRAH